MRMLPLALVIITTLAPAPISASDQANLESILADDHRSEENRARDVYRHPIDTLEFFGLEPDMNVVEIWPGGGWYAEVLAPYLKDEGRYTAAFFGPESYSFRDYYMGIDERLSEKFAADPERYGAATRVDFWPLAGQTLAADGSVDMIVTFRNLHNWLMAGYAEQAVELFYRSLKPGGVLGVIDHRADPRRATDPGAGSGYVDEAFAIQVIQSAGFVLEASSDINDNPLDTSDHPRGVWTLPPRLRLGDEDREHYESIGESDRFTLRFRKPID